MKIISFAVNNFRGITGGLENNTIKFENSNTIFLFGQNNVGKSTFLKAYEYLVKNETVQDKDYFNQNKKSCIELEVVLKLEDSDDTKLASHTGWNSFKQKANKNSHIKVKKSYVDNKSKFETFNWETNGWEDGMAFGLGTVFGAVLPKPIFIKAMPTEDDVKNTINDIMKLKAEKKLAEKEREELKEAKQKIKELQDKIYSPESIKKYSESVNKEFEKLFPDLSFEITDQDNSKFTHDKIGKKFDILCKNKKNQNQDTNIPENLISHGHGTVRSAIFTFLMLQDEISDSPNKDIIILFEEPELFLHPKLTKKLRELMYKITDADTPFQVICASHSPQMIDMSKDHTTIVKMMKDNEDKTKLFQVDKNTIDIKNQQGKKLSSEEKKKELQSLLRFNPYVCESFYADEVVLVEGDTEAIVWRAYLEEFRDNKKDIFVVNCGSVSNIPFYQEIFSKFNIKYSVICDTDHIKTQNNWNMECESPSFDSHIQKSIQTKFEADKKLGIAQHFFVFDETFEPAHEKLKNPFKFDNTGSGGKPFNANRYWEVNLLPNKDSDGFKNVPIIKYIQKILKKQ